MSTNRPSPEIVHVAIHPGIGIARVGNSREPEGYYIGPEVTNPTPYELCSLKDDKGAIKRQAARFRIYGYDKEGNVVREVTLDDPNTKIRWSVEIANKKSGWYEFVEALDLEGGPHADRRNANIAEGDRHKLEICPKPQHIAGTHQGPKAFHDGKFMDKKVYLGELRTDDKGRLLFLGGYGESASAYANNPPASFGNNNGWHDDTSDGSVSATVTIDGQDFEADQAWVVTAPPNYGTTLIGVKTMYDVMADVYINPGKRANWWEFPDPISFTQHILPIFQQFSDAQWVNYGFSVMFGHDGPFDFTNTAFLRKLSTLPKKDSKNSESSASMMNVLGPIPIPSETTITPKTDIYQEFRRQIYEQFRQPTQTDPTYQPNPASPTIQLWPWMYGDTVQLGDAPQDANQYLCLTNTQLKILQEWVKGNFVSDLKLPDDAPSHIDISSLYDHTFPTLDEYPLSERPGEMDRAAMHFCLGGAFHPGCEMTWPMRHASMYRAPFRIRPRTSDNPEPSYGTFLSHAEVNDDNGPLYFNAPGDITRWMAVPWQTDTSSCRSGYLPQYDPFLPTFWPARVPNQVLKESDYKIVMDSSQPMEKRLNAFNNRAVWLRGLPGAYFDQIREMVTEFGKLGIVEKRKGPPEPEFPDVIYVESEVGYPEPASDKTNLFCEYVPSPNEARYWRARKEKREGYNPQ